MTSHVTQAASTTIGPKDVKSLSYPMAGCNVGLSKLTNARLLWLNEPLAVGDEALCGANASLDEYKTRLIDACSFRVSATTKEATHWGIADRYGGSGLNGNGGAGRAVLLNGYYIKGVGQTPLIGNTTDRTHATGDAYLEEACREAIFAELFAAELPFGAVQTLAIIDTGEQAYWPEVDKYETKVLVVRKPVWRVGHFVRALGHRSLLDRSGSQDAARVDGHLLEWFNEIGPAALCDQLTILVKRVARQFGYCFAHRMTHGSPTLSNIAIDGRLLDFGASSSLPSYACSRLSPVSAGITYDGTLAQVLDELHEFSVQCERSLAISPVDWSAHPSSTPTAVSA